MPCVGLPPRPLESPPVPVRAAACGCSNLRILPNVCIAAEQLQGCGAVPPTACRLARAAAEMVLIAAVGEAAEAVTAAATKRTGSARPIWVCCSPRGSSPRSQHVGSGSTPKGYDRRLQGRRHSLALFPAAALPTDGKLPPCLTLALPSAPSVPFCLHQPVSCGGVKKIASCCTCSIQPSCRWPSSGQPHATTRRQQAR